MNPVSWEREPDQLFQGNFLLEFQDGRYHFPCSKAVEILLASYFEILSLRKNTVKMTACTVNSHSEKMKCIFTAFSLSLSFSALTSNFVSAYQALFSTYFPPYFFLIHPSILLRLHLKEEIEFLSTRV